MRIDDRLDNVQEGEERINKGDSPKDIVAIDFVVVKFNAGNCCLYASVCLSKYTAVRRNFKHVFKKKFYQLACLESKFLYLKKMIKKFSHIATS